MPLSVDSSPASETLDSSAVPGSTDTSSLASDETKTDTSTSDSLASGETGKSDVVETKDADGKDKEPEAKKDDKPAKKPEEGKVIELSRAKRTAEAKASKEAERADKAEAELKKYEPYHKLLDLAGSDPQEFISQLAQVTDLPVEKVVEAFATAKAGGEAPKDEKPAATPAEERLAALEKRIAEKEAKETAEREAAAVEKKEKEYAEARTKNVSTTLEFLKANEDEYPAAFADGEEAAEAIYEVVEARWAALKKAGEAPTDADGIQDLYKKAAERVNKILVEQTERRAAKLGYKREEKKASEKDAKTAKDKADPKSFKGLSSEHTGKNSPARDPNAVLEENEILEIGNKIFGL